jgi:hypothetical protein
VCTRSTQEGLTAALQGKDKKNKTPTGPGEKMNKTRLVNVMKHHAAVTMN